MKLVRRIAELLFAWLALWLVLHTTHWLLIRYFGSVLPPAYSPALWTVDGIDAFFLVVFMTLQDYVNKIIEKRQAAFRTHPAARGGDPPEAGR